MMFLKHFTPVRIAITLTVLLVLWMLMGEHERALEEAPAPQQQTAEVIPRIEFTVSTAEPWQNEVVVQGQIEPWQQVTVKAQVNGRVDQLYKFQGDPVVKGEPLLQLSDEGRSERLAQARAAVRLSELELASAQELKKSKFVAATNISRFENALADAKANLAQSQLALKYSQPNAPFDGVVNRRYIEQGELVAIGGPLVDIVDVKELKVIAYVPQQKVSALTVGDKVYLQLLDARKAEGSISFVSYAAEDQTRSYYIEVNMPNPEGWRVAGASVTLRIESTRVSAHRFSPALLSLSDNGSLGVKTINAKNLVEFYPVTILQVGTDEAVVTGLPDTVRLATLGSGFVAPGQEVLSVEAIKEGKAE